VKDSTAGALPVYHPMLLPLDEDPALLTLETRFDFLQKRKCPMSQLATTPACRAESDEIETRIGRKYKRLKLKPSEYYLTNKITLDKTLGYMYFMDKSHPLCDKKGRVWYHRHVASVSAGRWVKPEEIVHHVDHNRSNNDASNLEILESNSIHVKEHMTEKFKDLERVVAICPNCGDSFTHTPGQVGVIKYCSKDCSRYRINWPSDISLMDMVWEIPASQIADFLGVSGTALKKYCSSKGIPTPPRGYWS